MDNRNRSTRARQYGERRDIFIWQRVYSNVLLLNALREENNSIVYALKETKTKLETNAGSDNANKYRTKLMKYLGDGELSSERIKAKTKEIRDDLKILKTMQANKDYINMPEWAQKRPPSDIEAISSKPMNRIKSSHDKHIPIGTQVVSKVEESKDPTQEWILATVIHYYPEKNKYQVEDAEADDDGQKAKYILSARFIIPLKPGRDSPEFEFPEDHLVLALYPNTTCFYKAKVLSPPSKNKLKGHHHNCYMVYFDDDDFVERWVERSMVLDWPASAFQ